jgi:hypothetical protein
MLLNRSGALAALVVSRAAAVKERRFETAGGGVQV